jgi:hypothetical protein
MEGLSVVTWKTLQIVQFSTEEVLPTMESFVNKLVYQSVLHS